jgi:hypothetical protein
VQNSAPAHGFATNCSHSTWPSVQQPDKSEIAPMTNPPAAAHSVAVVGNLVHEVPKNEFIFIQVCCMASSHVGVPVYAAAVLHTSEAIMDEPPCWNENEYSCGDVHDVGRGWDGEWVGGGDGDGGHDCENVPPPPVVVH